MNLGGNWGATDREHALPLACDELLRGSPVRLHRAISVAAPASVVFAWLCQLKLAPYSYDLLDNWGRRSPRELVGGVEQLAVGQRFMTIFALESFVTDEHVTLRSRRAAVTYALVAGQEGTRLLVRILMDLPGGRFGSALTGPALALGDLVMMRKQLLTIKGLAERDVARSRRRPCADRSGPTPGCRPGGPEDPASRTPRHSALRSPSGPSADPRR